MPEQTFQDGDLAIVAVLYDDKRPAFFHTVGLHGYGLPEALVIGSLPPSMACDWLWNAANCFLEYGPPNDYAMERDIAAMPLVYRRVDAEKAIPWMMRAVQRYNEPVETVQIVWPDDKGKFPWHSGNRCAHAQGYLIDFSKEMRQ